MKLKIEKKEFEKKVRTAAAAAASNTSMEILKTVKICAGDTGINLYATDLNMGISTNVEGEIVEPGEIAVDARLLSEFVKKMPDGDVKLETDNGNTLKLSCKKSKLKLAGKDPKQFPIMPDTSSSDSFTLKQAEFRDAVQGVLFAIAPDDNNKLMTGVNFRIQGDELRFCALDGHRIAIRNLPVQNVNAKNVTIPGQVLKEVQKLVSAKGDDMIRISFTESLVVFTVKDTTLTGRLLEGDYFKIEQMIGNNSKTSLVINKQEFLESLDRSVLFTTAVDHRPVVFGISNEGIDISINSPIGKMKEHIDSEKTGDDLDIAFNPNLLIDVMRVIDDEDIKIDFLNAKTPCRITGKDYLYITLPVNFIKNAA